MKFAIIKLELLWYKVYAKVIGSIIKLEFRY